MAKHPSPTPAVSSNPALAQGLRDLADWLDEHPELPDVRYTSACFHTRYTLGTDARAELEVVARALGERAVEKRQDDNVSIEGAFAPDRLLTVRAEASVHQLRQEPVPVPDYEPIIDRPYTVVGLAVAS
ncbi:MAG TPA: hypothetical protein VG275_07110 [Solirubrobacteraceae bacterium]|jgi:hypothetical protein|nr:hypothetical protein [Solirubrobacteraceae bacterium]